jgi:glycosyltransferase involved in cell wall biosynthesis
MRIAIDARKLFDGGIGTYTRRLAAELATSDPALDLVLLVDPADAGRVHWPRPLAEHPVSAGKYGLDEHWRVPAAARAAGAELLHEPHYTLPLLWSGPSVVTIHDLIHVRFPHFFPPGAGTYARVVAGQAVGRARVVCVDSECTRRDVLELLHAPPGKVHVVPLGIAPELTPPAREAAAAWRAARGLPEHYVLYVGARRRHKNLSLLLEAWRRMNAAQRPPLVLSGGPWAADDPLAREAASLGVATSVHFAGEPKDDRELALLYGAAGLYVQPSLYEGFGLPPLEAMACGTPVLSSDAGSLREVCGGAATLLPPRDPDAWAARVLDLLGDATGRRARVAGGIAHAATFRWERTARLTRAAYDEALRRPA